MTIGTMDEDRHSLSSLSASPLHSRFDLRWFRRSRIPRRYTHISILQELRLSRQLRSAINNGRITRRQSIRGRRPTPNIHTLTYLSIRLFPTHESSNHRKGSNKIQKRAENNECPYGKTPICVFSQQHRKIDKRV
uniref:Uncharacterized protein n=1 Tax=Opuntia streptacantha TaxID=393608 RepID=A0A7C9FDY4_OPUST